jgi:hypothetical protein
MSTKTTTQQTTNDETTTTEVISPYKAATIVNAILLEKGIDKVLPPQMFYNYTTGRIRLEKKPFIDVVVDENNKVWIKVEGLIQWAEKYVAKQLVTVES